jgi:hypothetical protein
MAGRHQTQNQKHCHFITDLLVHAFAGSYTIHKELKAGILNVLLAASNPE